MKDRRVQEEIEEESNPFSVPKSSSIDDELRKLQQEEENEKIAGDSQKV